MARQPQYLHADALNDAIRQAAGMLEAFIERVEVVGSMIHVEAGGRRLVFRISQSEGFDPASGAPLLGSTSGEAVLVSGPEAIIAGNLRWLGRLVAWVFGAPGKRR